MCIHPILVIQRLGKNVPAAKNDVGSVVFYVVCAVLKDSRRLVPSVTTVSLRVIGGEEKVTQCLGV
jgi:hypothetical protein